MPIVNETRFHSISSSYPVFISSFMAVIAYLDRFKVDQGIHSDCRSLVVSSIGLLPELCSPCRCLDCKPSIGCHSGRCYGCKGWSKLVCQDAAHHGNF